MKISSKGFKEAVARLEELGDVGQTDQFREVLVQALEPIRTEARANINSISGRTDASIIIVKGKGQTPSAYIKIDKKVVRVMWKGKPLAYPYPVEYGHGGPRPAPPHPFFEDAYRAARAQVRAIVNEAARDILNPYTSPVAIGGEFS